MEILSPPPTTAGSHQSRVRSAARSWPTRAPSTATGRSTAATNLTSVHIVPGDLSRGKNLILLLFVTILKHCAN